MFKELVAKVNPALANTTMSDIEARVIAVALRRW
jgi:hypothetical protein